MLAFGDNTFGQRQVPGLPEGMHYVAIAAGYNNSILLRSDGEALVLGVISQRYASGYTAPEILPEGTRYIAAAVGNIHGILLRSDGQALGRCRFFLMVYVMLLLLRRAFTASFSGVMGR